MVASVTQGYASLAFTYDTEHARLKQCIPNCTSPTTTTIYLNDAASGSTSEKFVSGSTTTWRDYIIADGKVVAERFNTGGTITINYFMLDHLGSVFAITDATCNPTTCVPVERDAYDAWGKRRNTDGSDATACPSNNPAPSRTTRGFSNQEQMDSVCLTNLNARIYDPVVGRFLSADDLVPDIYGPQTLNRFSYVNNNPLSFTDPSGHDSMPGTQPQLDQTANSAEQSWQEANDIFSYSFAANFDMAAHAQSPGTDGPKSQSPTGITQTTTFNGPEGSLITVTPDKDENGDYKGWITFDRNSELGKTIDAMNAEGAGLKYEGGGIFSYAPFSNSAASTPQSGTQYQGPVETVMVTAPRDPNLSAPWGPAISEGGQNWQQYRPMNGVEGWIGREGERWQFYGGDRIRVRIQPANGQIVTGFSGSYEVNPVDKDGNIIPILENGPNDISSHVASIVPIDRVYLATFHSPSGYYFWNVALGELRDPVADNTEPFYFSVYSVSR